MSLLDVLKDPAARVPRSGVGAPDIVDLDDPDEVILPLEYPGQILFSPLVAAGDEVACGQAIGRSPLGNCVHASINGRVKEIRTVWSARSSHVPAVVIERVPVTELTTQKAPAHGGLDPATATRIELLKAGGVISPWTTPGRDHFEADMAEYPEIQHVVIKGFNEEPTVSNFELLLRENAETLRDGVHRFADIVPQATIWLTVREGIVDWAREVFAGVLEVTGVSEVYQQRLERLVVPRVTGVPVPNTDAYRTHGVAVMSSEHALTALAALRGHPFTHKTVTIAGGPIDKPLTVRTPLGTTVRDVLRSQGLDREDFGRIVMGGPMMGMALYADETPLSKFQHGIYLLRREELPSEINLTCINCGRCARACPVNLQVHLLGRCVEYDQFAGACEYHPEACLECGLCTFVCPSHRPLVQLVRMAKRYGSCQP